METDDDVRVCGLVLAEMPADHPLQQNNCQQGDVIVSINDTQVLVTTPERAAALLPNADNSTPVRLTLELARNINAAFADVLADQPVPAPRPKPAKRVKPKDSLSLAEADEDDKPVKATSTPTPVVRKTSPPAKPPPPTKTPSASKLGPPSKPDPPTPQTPPVKTKAPPTRPRAPSGSKLARSVSVDSGPTPPGKPLAKSSLQTVVGTETNESATTAQLTAQLADKDKELAKLEADLAAQAERVHVAEAKVHQLEQQVEEMSGQQAEEASVLQTALNGASGRMETLQKELDKARASEKAKDKEFAAVKQQLSATQQQLSTVQQELHAATSTAVTEADLAALNEEWEAKMAMFEKRLDKANSIIADKRKENEALTAQLAAIKQDKDDKGELEASTQALQSEVAGLKEQLRTSQSAAETERNKLTADNATLRKQLQQHQSDQSAKTSELEAALAKIATLQAQLDQGLASTETQPQTDPLKPATPAPIPAAPTTSASVSAPAAATKPTAAARKPKPDRPPAPPSPTPKPRPKPAARRHTTGTRPTPGARPTSIVQDKEAAAKLSAALMGGGVKPKPARPDKPQPSAEDSALTAPDKADKADTAKTDSGLDDVFGALPAASTLNNSAGRARAASASRAKVKRRPPTRHTSRARSSSPASKPGSDSQVSSPLADKQAQLKPLDEETKTDPVAPVRLRAKPSRGESGADEDPVVKRRSKFGAIGAGLKKLRRKSGAVTFDAENPPAAATWTPAEVGTWLQSTGIADADSLVEVFGEAKVDGETLLSLTTGDSLKSLGVTSVAQRTQLKKKILDLRTET
eukprot:TRINITY_DN12397_c2_g1_i3.p1 TRINITY_DN12397_c2_g1~~TRINITY_DN12397_c2_g1_i3.p1  ORF type:complete len:832 (+),score=254.23 TRINITY_DN12397_c2_g1_i3:62-2497(+)